MPACCVCYTTDPTYLLPTLVSAIQARRQSSPEKADILVLAFGADSQSIAIFSDVCSAEGIRLIPCGTDAIEGAPAMLARLFLARLLPEQYSQFLYMDGDTQVRGSLDPLIEAPVPAGRFLAANDPMTFAIPGRDAESRFITQHFAALGLAAPGYFNSGVLRINRSGWDEIGRSAWQQFRQAGASRFPDQDVLNTAGAKSRIPMSLAWNFPIYMLNARVRHAIAPRILHFMSNPKPWHGMFQPWGAAGRAPYLDVINRYPELHAYLDVMPAGTRARYHLQQHAKQLMETFVWGLGEKRRRILSYERSLATSPALTSPALTSPGLTSPVLMPPVLA